ncbi:MAG: hypothetical protein P8Y24_02940 [Gammaproteobacteria bacterium]|jgi:hypothetical protein
MKKLFVLLTAFFLANGVAFAEPSSSDCGDDDVKPINLTANQQS